MKFRSLLFTMLVGVLSFAQVPTITSFSPTQAEVGATVTISGSNFSSTTANNIVRFGSVLATVNSASTTQLTVTVPQGAIYAPISVVVSNKIGQSRLPFHIINPNTAASVGTSTSNWGSGVSITSGTYSAEAMDMIIASGDFDGNGWPDVVKIGSGNLHVHRNLISSAGTTIATSSFSAATTLATDGTANCVVTGDVNADGKLDIISAGGSGINIFINNSSIGSFNFAAKYLIPSSGTNIVRVADIDLDGLLDFVGFSGSDVKIWKNTTSFVSSTWTFSVGSITTVNVDAATAGADNIESFDLGDMNLDGKIDIVLTTANATSGGCVKLVANTNSAAGTMSAVYTNSDIAVGGGLNLGLADIDADGDLDIMTRAWKLLRNDNAGTITSNSFSGSFTTLSLSLYEYLYGIAFADFRGIGRLDMTGGTSWDKSWTHFNLSNPLTTSTFPGNSTSRIQIGAATSGYGVCTGPGLGVDLNGDNKIDFLSSSHYNSSFAVIQNLMGAKLNVSQAITTFNKCVNSASAQQSFTVSGSELQGNIIITPPSGFEISTTSGSGFGTTAITLTPTSGTVNTTTIYVRIPASNNTASSGTLTVVSTGASTVNISLASTMLPDLVVTGSPSTTAQSYCISGSATALTASATGPSVTYQWQQATTSNGTFTGAVGGSGATTNSYTPPTTTAGTLYYRCYFNSSCGNTASAASGAITVNSNNTAGTASSNPAVCVNTTLTAITRTTTGATGIGTATGLPAGVTAAWSANTLTVSGTPTASGTFNYSIPLTGGCGTVNATGSITVNALPSAPTTSNLTLCQGATASQLTATGTVGNTLYWTSSAINQTTSNVGQTLSNGIYTIGQSFTAATAMSITGIVYNFESVYVPSADLTLTLYSGQGLGGTVLSTVNINGSITAGEFTFTLPTAISLTQGQVYTFNLSTTTSTPLTVRWNYNNGDAYSGGYYWRFGSAFVTDDIYFRVLTSTSTTAPTPSTATSGMNSYLVYQTNPTTGCSSSNSTLNVTVQSTNISGSTLSSTANTVYCLNGTATALTVNAPNATSFQWYAMDASNWAGQQAISGATTNTYTPPTNVAGTKYYRCYIASCSGTNTSSPVSGAITVTDGSVWTGAVSTDPTNAGNWNSTCGSGSKIINPGTTYSPEFTNLTIGAGETFTIIEGAKVNVTGILTNNGTLNINTGATLVQGATSTYVGSGTVNVGQRITGGSTASAPSGRFWYLGSPTTGGNATTFYSSSASNVVKERDEPNNAWNLVTNSSGTALTPGKGYYLRASNGTTSSSNATTINLNFTGGGLNNNPTSGALTIPCVRTSGVNFEGFNLVSNPYPSYLNWDLVTKTDVGNTMWYRAASGNTAASMVFETYVAGAAGGIGTNLSGNVATKLIPPMQAFWVRVNSGSTSGSITLDNSMRSHFATFGGSTAGLRSTNDELKLFLRMNLLQGESKDQLIVYVNGNATNGFDQLDGEKMMQATLPQFYTKVGDKKIVINGLNSAKKQQALPITMELPTTGVHTFEIENLELEAGLVWLEDTQEETMEALTEGFTYQFYGEAGLNNDRFVLHFNILDNTTPSAPNYGEVNSSANLSGKGASVHAESAGVVVIKLPASTEGITDIQIRDAAGRLVYTGSTNTLETSVQLEQANGIYYVTLKGTNSVEVRKVFVQQ